MAAMAQGIGGIVAPLLITPAMSYFTSPAAPFRFAGAGFIVAVMFAIAAFILLVGAGIVALSRTPWPHAPGPVVPPAGVAEREDVRSIR